MILDKVSKARRILRDDGPAEMTWRVLEYLRPAGLDFRYGSGTTVRDKGILKGHIQQQVVAPLNEYFHSYRYPMGAGTNFFEEDWDNLILLDACRYDAFRRVNHLDDGYLEKRTSVGSLSPTFMKRSFEDRTYHDTVYVSANAHISAYVEDTFHDVVNVWDDGWDDEIDAVPPAAVTEAALEAYERFPDKRLCIHYMQPHTPYIGKLGMELKDRADWMAFESLSEQKRPNIVWGLRYNLLDIDTNELWQLYEENVALALKSVEAVLSAISGKTVISADHGELLGDTVGPISMKQYGHPPLYTPELREVPWFVIENEQRRTITAAEPNLTDIDDDAEETIKEQLEALGYTE